MCEKLTFLTHLLDMYNTSKLKFISILFIEFFLSHSGVNVSLLLLNDQPQCRDNHESKFCSKSPQVRSKPFGKILNSRHKIEFRSIPFSKFQGLTKQLCSKKILYHWLLDQRNPKAHTRENPEEALLETPQF